jgi:hypothetical protein
MTDELVTCPACRESISKLATKCPKCQSLLVTPTASQSAGSYIVLTIVSIGATALLYLFWQWFGPVLMGI